MLPKRSEVWETIVSMLAPECVRGFEGAMGGGVFKSIVDRT